MLHYLNHLWSVLWHCWGAHTTWSFSDVVCTLQHISQAEILITVNIILESCIFMKIHAPPCQVTLKRKIRENIVVEHTGVVCSSKSCSYFYIENQYYIWYWCQNYIMFVLILAVPKIHLNKRYYCAYIKTSPYCTNRWTGFRDQVCMTAVEFDFLLGFHWLFSLLRLWLVEEWLIWLHVHITPAITMETHHGQRAPILLSDWDVRDKVMYILPN